MCKVIAFVAMAFRFFSIKNSVGKNGDVCAGLPHILHIWLSKVNKEHEKSDRLSPIAFIFGRDDRI